ncbi:unnamed protein product, partial [marine sediment metagenome]
MYFVENRENDAGDLRRIAEIDTQKQEISPQTSRASPSQLGTAEFEDAVAEIRSERDGLADELRIIQFEREQLNNRLVKVESEQELLITEREQLRSSLAKAETEREHLESAQVRMSSSLRASNAKGEQLTGERTELRTSLQMANNKLERLESERISLRGNLTAAINERERLAAELKSMLDARKLLSSDLQKTREE